MVVTWAAVLGVILSHRLFVSHDTMINYAHAWYLGEGLRHGRVPLSMPVVGGGRGFTFPYGVVPWLIAGALWPLLGEWSVTLVLVAGALGLVVATFWAFPEAWDGWWGAAVLANPLLVAAPIIGQIPFMWGAALLLGGVGLWRHGHRGTAGLLAGLGQATHPAVVLPIAAGTVAARLRWEPNRRALVAAYAASLVIALPTTVLVLRSPVFQDTTVVTKVSNFFGTDVARAPVILVPAVLVALRARRGRSWPWLAPAAFVVLLGLNLALAPALESGYAWRALRRQPDTQMLGFVVSGDFVPGATYRILRAGDGKVGMYQVLRGGGRLDSEFFPESIDRRRHWPDAATYLRFLRHRNVDFVMVWASYDSRYRTNEHALLEGIAGPGPCRPGPAGVATVAVTDAYAVFAVDRPCPPSVLPAAISASSSLSAQTHST
jgi:hypothetical protein